MTQAGLITNARQTGDGIEVDFTDGLTARFHQTWLRDTCRCSECRHPDTLRRVNESMSIPVELTARSVHIADGGTALHLAWPDGHTSVVEAPWLHRNAQVDGSGSAVVDRTQGKPVWGAELVDRLPWMEYEQVVSEPAAMLCWLETIDQLGFALLNGMPTDRATMSDLAARIGPVRASNYGVDWEIEATTAPKNAVYSARGLSAHTDLPYRANPPGLQFLLADLADAPGGESMLVDGYRVAEALFAERPEMWTTLTETAVGFSYVDEHYDLRYDAPVIGLRPDGSYGVFRHAPGLLEPFDPLPETFRRVYTAMHRFTELLRDPLHEVRIRLEAGQMIAFDNVRVLHGRAPFDLGPGGRRHLLGCYIDLDDLHSRIRVLRRAEG